MGDNSGDSPQAVGPQHSMCHSCPAPWGYISRPSSSMSMEEVLPALMHFHWLWSPMALLGFLGQWSDPGWEYSTQNLPQTWQKVLGMVFIGSSHFRSTCLDLDSVGGMDDIPWTVRWPTYTCIVKLHLRIGKLPTDVGLSLGHRTKCAVQFP